MDKVWIGTNPIANSLGRVWVISVARNPDDIKEGMGGRVNSGGNAFPYVLIRLGGDGSLLYDVFSGNLDRFAVCDYSRWLNGRLQNMQHSARFGAVRVLNRPEEGLGVVGGAAGAIAHAPCSDGFSRIIWSQGRSISGG